MVLEKRVGIINLALDEPTIRNSKLEAYGNIQQWLTNILLLVELSTFVAIGEPFGVSSCLPIPSTKINYFNQHLKFIWFIIYNQT